MARTKKIEYWNIPNGTILKVTNPGYGFLETEKIQVTDNQKINDKRGNWLIKRVESLDRNYAGCVPKKYTK